MNQGIEAYRQQGNHSADALIKQHLGLVRRIALHLSGTVGHTASVDDLMQSGLVGLIEAAGRYDSTQRATFEQFARRRIHGAMIDLVRQGDWRPRRTREETQKITRTTSQLEKNLGRVPHDREIAEVLGVSLEKYQEMAASTHAARLLSLDEVLETGDGPSDSEEGLDIDVFHACEQDALAEALKQLPERTQQLFNLYYVQEMNMKEIALVFDVSEARVCQLHGQGLKKLKTILKDWSQ